jgi:ABC-type multidrug transport system ATPase subunit
MSYLERFLFNKYDALRTVANLSGGEKARLLLAKLMLEHANMLILDEPTNDLDIPTLHILERSLMEFQGGILFTSHDRYFMQRVATAVLTNTNNDINESKSENKWTLFADLDQALNQILNTKENTSNLKPEPVKTNTVQNKSPKSNSHILKEIAALENKINGLEHKINELTQKLNELYYQEKKQQEILILSKEVEGYQSELNHAYLQWESLMSKNI